MNENLVEIRGEETTQNISTGICQMANYPDFVSYRAVCSCQSADHDQTIVVEYDEDIEAPTITLYYTASTNELGSNTDYFRSLWMTTDNWFVSKYATVGWWLTDMWNRFKYAAKIIFTGRIQLETAYLFEQQEHITSYLNALHSALDKMVKNSAKYNK